MSYLALHHGSYYFQIRVPAALVAQFGPIIRVNLQTADRGIARPIALRLASDWLARFSTAHETARSDFAGVSLIAEGGLESPPLELLGVQQRPAPVAPSAGFVTPQIIRPLHARSVSDDDLLDAWKRIDRTREASTEREMQAAIRVFRQFTKVPAAELVRSDVAAFRDHLLDKKLARATVSKKIGFISTLLQVGFDAGLLSENVARGLKIPKAKVPTLVRRAFTVAELTRIFTSRVYSQGFRPIGGGGEACAWLPMIALATGARLEEIAQLRSSDIYVDGFHGPVMRITDEDPEQRLKTEGSRRTVPLHPDLIRVGLLEYVETIREISSKWLFPALEPDHDGRRGGNWGKWFQRYLRTRSGLGISDPTVVFHSFRHTFKTLCRAAMIPEDVHDALTGHVSASISRQYGEMPLAPLVAAIAAVKLPVALPRIQL
ncbi:site-specific integrase [Aromatoleum toluclasticum]|uniref:site-specific integrase n=1 Tax=Aromatoleum toluclasticum TaxID=92003 RepID=UPI001D1826AF|nr:site-specific integrase [Aromatoleum toluclasticum]MCC4118555.1 site-specific integrase [Aromatoleum toluclasticum]